MLAFHPQFQGVISVIMTMSGSFARLVAFFRYGVWGGKICGSPAEAGVPHKFAIIAFSVSETCKIRSNDSLFRFKNPKIQSKSPFMFPWEPSSATILRTLRHVAKSGQYIQGKQSPFWTGSLNAAACIWFFEAWLLLHACEGCDCRAWKLKSNNGYSMYMRAQIGNDISLWPIFECWPITLQFTYNTTTNSKVRFPPTVPMNHCRFFVAECWSISSWKFWNSGKTHFVVFLLEFWDVDFLHSFCAGPVGSEGATSDTRAACQGVHRKLWCYFG